MRLQPILKRLNKRVLIGQKRAATLGVKAEKGFEKYFLQKIGKVEFIQRFVFEWLFLMVLLIGGLLAQNILLSNYYQTVKAVPGGIYKEGIIGSFTNANPVYAVTEVDSSVSRLLFDGLFTYDENGNVVGDLAEGYTIDSHGTTYTVKLRPNLKWHDGKPLTSADVVYTYHTIQNPDVQSPFQSSWQGVSVSAPDARTVVIKLPTPLASFIYGLTMGIIPEHILKKVPATEFRSTDFNTIHPVGSGPFKWQAIEVSGSDLTDSQQQIAMTAFNNYYAGPPKLQEFVIHSYTNKDQLVEALKTKQLTAASGLSEIPKALIKNNSDLEEHSFLLRAATMVFFKTSSGILADQKVRAALVQSSDTNSVLKVLGYETHPVRGPLLSNQVAYDPKLAEAKFDLKAAQAALTADGWIPGKGGIREKGNAKLTFELIAQDTPEYSRVSGLLKKQWRSAGVDVKVTILNPTEFQLNLSSHSYDAVLYGISIGVDPDVFVYWDSTQADIRSAHRLNLSEYKSAAADTSLEAGRSRTDPVLRTIKYKPFLQAWQNDAPALALYQPRFLYLTNGPVDGLPRGAFTTPIDRFVNVNNWQIRQAKVTNP